LKQKVTRQLFSSEQYLPSPIIDRDSIRGWHQDGDKDTVTRAHERVILLLQQYQQPNLPQHHVHDLVELVKKQAQLAGMNELPSIEI
jgi:trimethylamine:corrinoid methyltransferase-like protein